MHSIYLYRNGNSKTEPKRYDIYSPSFPIFYIDRQINVFSLSYSMLEKKTLQSS